MRPVAYQRERCPGAAYLAVDNQGREEEIMRIKWRKFQGGYEVMLYLEDTKCVGCLAPMERWSVSTFYGPIKGSGSKLIPI